MGRTNRRPTHPDYLTEPGDADKDSKLSILETSDVHACHEVLGHCFSFQPP